MKAALTPLRNLLNSGQFFVADVYTFTLVDGTILRYTSFDRDISNGGNLFLSTGPRIERSRGHWKIGVEVDQMEITIYPQSTDTVSGQTFMAAVRLGLFDGAEVKVERAFMASLASIAASSFAIDPAVGTVVIEIGRVGSVEAESVTVKITLNSHLELLNQSLPRNIYQPGCVHTLFDAGCTLLKSTFTFARTVTAGATASRIPMTDGAHSAGYFDLGTVTFTSGANNGISRSIKRWDAVALDLLTPLPAAPSNGDTMNVTAGDDKTQATCTTKFSNANNFRGFPYIPVAETAI